MDKKSNLKRSLKGKKQQWIFYWAILVLPLLQFCIFYIGTIFNSITLPFKRYELGEFIWDSEFLNLKWAFNELRFFKPLARNSTILYLTGTLVGTTLALLFSYYIYKQRAGSSWFRVFLFMPQIISGAALAIMFKYFVERGVPIINETLTGEMIEGLIENYDTRFGTILFYTIWAGFGSQVLMYTGAMSGISDSLTDAAQIDGMSAFCEFIHITVPCIWSTLVTFLVVGIAHFFTGQMNLHAFLGVRGDYDVSTFGYYIYQQLSIGDQALYPRIAAFGLMFTVIAVPVTLVVKRLLEKYGPRTD